MKKYISIIFILMACLLITGCKNKEPYGIGSIEEETFVDLGELGKGIAKYDLVCNEIQDIIDYNIDDSLFITNDGKLFQLNYEKLYSNNKNCKQIESNKIFTKFIHGGIIDNNNDIYYLQDEILKEFHFEIGHPTMPYIPSVSPDKYPNIIYTQIDLENYDYLNLENNILYSIINNTEVFNAHNEKILKIMDNTIITDKTYYIYNKQIINQNECQKYADIDCIFKNGFNRLNNEKITSQYDKIKFFKYGENNTVLIIDINNNVYYGNL